MKCPSFERLIDYLDGRLTASEVERIDAHLATDCAHCKADAEWYRTVKSTASEDETSDPPSWVLKRALRIFETRSKPTLVERLGQAVASLVFDSFARPALAGIRSADAAVRQLLYRAGEFSIDVQVVPAGRSRVNLHGQVLREGELAFESVGQLELELIKDGSTVLSVSTNGLGEFSVNGVEPGVFDLRIHVPERIITVPDVPIALP
jgi:hypothetical protein